jgi:hypothetical protein
MLLLQILVALQSAALPANEPCTSGPEICTSLFYESLANNLSDQERADKTSLYSDRYLDGLLGLDVPSVYKDHYKGAVDGAAFRKKHPEQLTKTLALFGYRYLELKGSISEGFEFSHLAPKNVPIVGYDKYWWTRFDAKRGWWYRGDLGFADKPPNSQRKVVPGCPSATIKGYLSPRGLFGHMAVYSHEFVVTQFTCD